jgi:ethanolamine ammonia-lyase small subunit
MSDREKDTVTGTDAPMAAASREISATSALVDSLRRFTPARVALQRAGTSLATAEILAFQMAHAHARDAVHADLDVEAFGEHLREAMQAMGLDAVPVLSLKSSAPDRAAYLRRPDLGRQLDASSEVRPATPACDVVFVVGDGLSAIAVERHAIPLLRAVLPGVIGAGWSLGPLCLVKQARVAIGDPIGEAFGAALSVVLIGERPGLSAADSLGAYITWQPKPGRTDAERNCISNIRDGGLGYEAAAARLLSILAEARSRQLTGTALKDPGEMLGEASLKG